MLKYLIYFIGVSNSSRVELDSTITYIFVTPDPQIKLFSRHQNKAIFKVIFPQIISIFVGFHSGVVLWKIAKYLKNSY